MTTPVADHPLHPLAAPPSPEPEVELDYSFAPQENFDDTPGSTPGGNMDAGAAFATGSDYLASSANVLDEMNDILGEGTMGGGYYDHYHGHNNNRHGYPPPLSPPPGPEHPLQQQQQQQQQVRSSSSGGGGAAGNSGGGYAAYSQYSTGAADTTMTATTSTTDTSMSQSMNSLSLAGPPPPMDYGYSSEEGYGDHLAHHHAIGSNTNALRGPASTSIVPPRAKSPPMPFGGYGANGDGATGEGGYRPLSRVHQFFPNTFLTPTFCDACDKMLLGVFMQGVKCAICGMAAHTACQSTICSQDHVCRAPEKVALNDGITVVPSVPRKGSFGANHGGGGGGQSNGHIDRGGGAAGGRVGGGGGSVPLPSSFSDDPLESAWHKQLVRNGNLWVPDRAAPSCMICKSLFTVIKRRHHCRRCGACVCSNCSGARQSDKVLLLDEDTQQVTYQRNGEPVRICSGCTRVLDEQIARALKRKGWGQGHGQGGQGSTGRGGGGGGGGGGVAAGGRGMSPVAGQQRPAVPYHAVSGAHAAAAAAAAAAQNPHFMHSSTLSSSSASRTPVQQQQQYRPEQQQQMPPPSSHTLSQQRSTSASGASGSGSNPLLHCEPGINSMAGTGGGGSAGNGNTGGSSSIDDDDCGAEGTWLASDETCRVQL